jgi:hypothetical protein
MANIKISQLPQGVINSDAIFPFVQSGTTYQAYVSGITAFNNIVLTKSELDSLISNNELQIGFYYTVTDADTSLYGGTEITLLSLSVNKLSTTGFGKFYNPLYDQQIDGYGIWSRYITPTFLGVTGGTFTVGETVISDTSGLATYVGDELLYWVNGNWDGAVNITGLTSGTIADIDRSLTPLYNVGDEIIWGGKLWICGNGTITGEIIGFGDNGTYYSGYTENNPNSPSQISIFTQIEDFTDDGSGNLIGTSGGTGTTDYNTGFWEITLSSSLSSDEQITCNYLTALAGTSLSKYSLSSLWSEIQFNEFNYSVVYDEIEYDYYKDKIISRKDNFGNQVSCTYQSITEFEINETYNLGNPIKDFQWGNNQTNYGTTPGLFLFNDVSSTNFDITDGGLNLLDNGNSLNTDLYSNIPYTHVQMTDPPINYENQAGTVNFSFNSSIVAGDTYFGPSSDYFTNLYPGLFVLVTENTSCDSFFIDGGVGADCNSDLNSYQKTYTSFTENYTAYVKRYYNNSNGNPSSNHIIIVNGESSGITHDFNSGGCDSDYHSVSGLTSAGTNKIYYLLLSQYPGEQIFNDQIDDIVEQFLNLVDNNAITTVITNLEILFNNITNILPESQTTYKYGIMGNKVIDSYMDCLNFNGGYIWNNFLIQNSIFSDNIFSPIRIPSFDNNNLSQESIFSYNTLTSNSDFSYNNLSLTDFINNKLNSTDTSVTYLKFNNFKYSGLLNNSFHNVLFYENILQDDSELLTNEFIESVFSENNILNNSSLSNNIIVNSTISGNLIDIGILSQNILSSSEISYNRLNESSIELNDLVNNGNIINNILESGSIVSNNSITGNSYVQYNTITQNSNIEYNNSYTNSYLQYNNLFYSKISGNSLNDSSFIEENSITNYSEISDNSILNSSFIGNNIIENGSYILTNTLDNGSEIIENTMSVGYLYENSLDTSTISRNILNINSEIYLNTLSSSNIWKNSMTSESSIYNGIFDNSLIESNSIKNSSINLSTSCIIDTKNIINTNFVDSIVNEVSENSIVIYENFSKNVFTNSTGITRVSYYDSSDTLIIGDINDSILPDLVISAWTPISLYNIDVTIDITSDNGSAVTERGTVWSITPYPTISDNIVTDGGTGIGSFTSSLTGLTADETIYFRGYAVNGNGTGYTCQDTYSTVVIP